MFVSSYSTYIDTTTTKKVQNQRDESSKEVRPSFTSKLEQALPKDVLTGKQLPLNYISNYKALNTRQRLDQQLEKKEMSQNVAKMKFSKINAQGSAKVSYAQNSQMFSLLAKPKATLDQTPRADRNLPQPAQENQKGFQRAAMVNTYISNDRYYQVTAA